MCSKVQICPRTFVHDGRCFYRGEGERNLAAWCYSKLFTLVCEVGTVNTANTDDKPGKAVPWGGGGGYQSDMLDHLLLKDKDRLRKFFILVPRGRARFGQHKESRPLARSYTGSLWFTDYSFLCARLESSLTNLIGSALNLLCLQIHSKPECRWTWPEVAIFGADQKERGLWGWE